MRQPTLALASSLAGCLVLLAGLVSPALAADYHVDFVAGDDANNGLTPSTAFKRCPGDAAATGLAAALRVLPGDRLLFKGGVVYRGVVAVKVSGEPGKPIVFDGNTAGTFGNGPAVIDGADPITGWKPCSAANEAKGNLRWAEIFYVDVPKPKSYKSLNLCDATTALPVAQHPNPQDFFWQEHLTNYLTAPGILMPVGGLRLVAEKGTKEDKKQPLGNLLTGNLAVISPIPGCGFTYTLEKAETITAVGIAAQPKYAALKEVIVLGDGQELLRLNLAKDDKGTLQRVDLPAPATVTTLTFRFQSLQDGESGNWSKLKQVAAFTAEGVNVLKGSDSMTFSDPANLDVLSSKQADWFDGMTFCLHAGNNGLFYMPIKGYDPITGTLTLPAFGDTQYKKSTYCLFNSVRLIDQPGEYSIDATTDPTIARVFLLPPAVKDGQPVNIGVSARNAGFALESASQITVQGFLLRRQSGNALSARQGAGIIFRDCEATLVNGTVISGNKVDGITIERCHIHDNPGHSKGIVLHTCTQAITRDCRLVRNTSTALDYYTCSDGQMVGNIITENLGMHANGLTLYVGCKNILVERNIVSKGNCALTFQEGENLIFRNNVLDSGGRTTVVGIWPSQPLKNVQFLNNTIVRSSATSEWSVGMFSNSRKIDGLVVRNNIIDGLFSDHDVFKTGTFSNNLYTRTAKDQKDGLLGTDELVETDLKKIFIDPDNGDFRLRVGSPAIAAGSEVEGAVDVTGAPRPAGKIDIGAYAFRE